MKAPVLLSIAALSLVVSLAGCAKSRNTTAGTTKTVVVTYSVLGSVLLDLVADKVTVRTAIPDGLDPHEWEPSARDIETLNKADLVVENGLGLEAGMEKTLEKARSAGVRFFTVSDYIAVRTVGEGEGIPSGDPDQAVGAADPHFWMDPIAMKAAVDAFAAYAKESLAVDLTDRARDLDRRLDSLDAEIRAEIAAIPAANRKLVTGHESMGYFAERYGFKLVGAVIPSLSTQAEVSASELAALIRLVRANGVKTVFTETGTPAAVVNALAREAGVNAVPLNTHSLPEDGSYFTFMRNLARTMTEKLR